MQHATRSVTINCPRTEVYSFWRRLENLPRFMYHLRSVTSTSDTRSHWVVRAPGGGVDIHYDPPGGAAGAKLARLFGEEPGQQLRDELRRFKQVMETGEVVLAEGSLEGAGEGATREAPS